MNILVASYFVVAFILYSVDFTRILKFICVSDGRNREQNCGNDVDVTTNSLLVSASRSNSQSQSDGRSLTQLLGPGDSQEYLPANGNTLNDAQTAKEPPTKIVSAAPHQKSHTSCATAGTLYGIDRAANIHVASKPNEHQKKRKPKYLGYNTDE